MARAGWSTSNYLTVPLSGIADTDLFTMVMLVTGSLGNSEAYMGVGDKDNGTNQHRLVSSGAGGLQASTFDGDNASSTAISPSGSGRHLVAARIANSERAAYVDGTLSGVETTSQTVANVDCFRIGTTPDSTPFGSMTLAVTWAALWVESSSGSVLTEDELDALYAGVHPYMIRPQSLVRFTGFMTGTGNEICKVSGETFTQTGTVTGSSDVLMTPIGGAWPANYTPAAGGGFQPAWAARSTITISGGMTR